MEQSWKTLIQIVAVLMVAVQFVASKPVNARKPPTPAPSNTDGGKQDGKTGLEYDHYLQQVVEALESDREFRKKLESANISDIKSGAIATHLQLVKHSIRTKLDEIKRMEISRLQQLARLKHMAARNQPGGRMNRMEIPDHLDLRNPHSFEIKDLENLILKTSRDLEDVDVKRRTDFKEYELEKEYEYQQKLKSLPNEEREKMKARHEQLQKKHQEHEKIQHPGSKDQFNEVWEKEDKMEDQDFDPRTFFMMHDLNNDMFWDIQEVEAVLQNELEKMYDNKNSPEEDDPMEKMEEMNRMREHVFTEIDKDKDLMISMEEFLQYTGKHGENKKFEENEGWETVDEQKAFTDEEYQEFVRKNHAQPGVVPPPVDNGNQDLRPEQQHPVDNSNLQFKPEEQLQQQQMMQHGMNQPVSAQQHIPQDGIAQQAQQHQLPAQEVVVGQQARPMESQQPPQQNEPVQGQPPPAQ